MTSSSIFLLALLTITLEAIDGSSICSLPNVSITGSCRCVHKEISCRGLKVDDVYLTNLFQNLSQQVPKYQQEIDVFELRDSSVKSLTPKVFGTIVIRGYIRLRNNRLTMFSIGNFNHLFMLDISNNQISKSTNMDDSFIGLNQVRSIHAAKIGLRSLKKEYFSHLKNLQRLDLSANEIEQLDIDAFSSEYDNNFQLRELDLSYNRIHHLPTNIFMVLRQPERINLANNRLVELNQIFRFNRDAIQYNPIQIILSNNSIRNDHFTNHTFNDLVERGHYIELDLTHNKLAWIDEEIFGKLLTNSSYGKSILLLNNNPIQCTNCRNRWLFRMENKQRGWLRSSIKLESCIEKKKRLFDYNLNDFGHC